MEVLFGGLYDISSVFVKIYKNGILVKICINFCLGCIWYEWCECNNSMYPGTNFSEILTKISNWPFCKIHLKISYAKCQSFLLFSMLMHSSWLHWSYVIQVMVTNYTNYNQVLLCHVVWPAHSESTIPIEAWIKWRISWWRYQMETFSALLALCMGNSLVTGEFPTQRPVTRSFDVFFDLRLE